MCRSFLLHFHFLFDIHLSICIIMKELITCKKQQGSGLQGRTFLFYFRRAAQTGDIVFRASFSIKCLPSLLVIQASPHKKNIKKQIILIFFPHLSVANI